MPSSSPAPSPAKPRKHLFFKVALPLLILGTGVLAVYQMRGEKGSQAETAQADPVVGRINQETVSAGEYRLIMERKASLVYSYFKQHHDLDDHLGYWNDRADAETPVKKLREMVQEELVRIKVYQGLGKEKGLIGESGYTQFHAAFEKENARRLAARQSGEVIYGPQQYRLAAYYYIKFGDLSYRLKQVIAKEYVPEITDADVKKFYDENKAAVGKKKLDEIRPNIIEALSMKKAEKELESRCAAAKVEMNEQLLRGIVPRVDSATASGAN